MSRRLAALFAALPFLVAAPASALPVVLLVDGTVTEVNGAVDSTPGDTFRFEVTLDNSGSDTLSQSYTQADIVQLMLTIGLQAPVEITTPYWGLDVATDGAGEVIAGSSFNFYASGFAASWWPGSGLSGGWGSGVGEGLSLGNDSLGLEGGSVDPLAGVSLTPAADYVAPPTVSGAAAVPVPPAIALLGGGLAALAALRRRRAPA